MISGAAAKKRGICSIAALKWGVWTWASPDSRSRNTSIRIHRFGSSALRHQSKEMFPSSERVALVNSSIREAKSSAYLARTGCLTTTRIIGTSLFFEQLGLDGHDPVVERLKGPPSRHRRSDLGRRLLGLLAVDEHRGPGGFGQQLRLAGALHGDEPPGRLVDRRLAHGQEAVIREDHGLVRAERMGDALSFLGVEHGTGVVAEHGMVAVERAGVLG